MLVDYRGFNVAFKKIGYTLLVIFACNILFSIKYPGITGTFDLKDNISYIVMSDMTGIFSQSTRPFIVSNIIMHMLAMIFPYFDKMRKEQDSRRLYEIITLFVMTTISITNSIIGVRYINQYILDSVKNSFFIYYSIINLVISLFVAWFNRQMLLNGMGHGISIILSLKIVNMYLKKNNIKHIFDVFSAISFYDLLFFLLCFMFAVYTEKFVIKINIYALTSDNYSISKHSLKGDIEYKPTHANIIANILTIQTTSLFNTVIAFVSSYNIVFFDAISNSVDSIFKTYGALTNVLFFIFRSLTLFIYNYLYNYVSHNHTYKLNETLRKNLCLIPGVRPGSTTDKFIDGVIINSSIISVLMTFGFFLIPAILQYILPCKHIITNGIDIMIVANSFIKVIEFMQAIYHYNVYSFNYSRLKKL